MLNNDCGWKDGDSGYSAARNLLTQTGLLMEGVITLCAIFSLMNSAAHNSVEGAFCRREHITQVVFDRFLLSTLE
jgi:hypothetical protein